MTPTVHWQDQFQKSTSTLWLGEDLQDFGECGRTLEQIHGWYPLFERDTVWS